MNKKFDQINKVLDRPTVETITTCKFDDFGEFLSTPFTEKIKHVISEELQVIR